MSKKLAIQGGLPVRDAILPYGQQWVDGDDISAVISALESDYITQGPAISLFEKAVASYVGAQYAVAFCNGTAALHGACFAAGIGPGDEVITSPITFIASSNCVLYQGGKPVFADIRKDTYNIDPEAIEKAITRETKAIVAVDFTGQSCEMDKIRKLADKYNLVVIQDAAHSLGASFRGRRVGSIADMTMFSFHPVKHITTGEGGIITTDSFEYYERLVSFRSHGMTRDPDKLLKLDGPWYYEMHDLGYNYRMTDLQAALGLSQMKKLEQFVVKRRDIAARYQEAFEGMEGVVIPIQHPLSESSWHLYVLRFESKCFRVERRIIFEALRAEHIGVNVHYIPVYKQPYYQINGYSDTSCLEAELYYSEAISIPIFPKMTDSDVDDVINAVQKVHAAFLIK